MSNTYTGYIRELQITDDSPAQYQLLLDANLIPLNPLLGCGLEVRFLGQIECAECGQLTKKSYGGGYCYPCFATLARCDLCVMSPDRCHFHLKTCRDPEWGESFCMQPHTVYLANSSGLKVGITRQGRETKRWLDQGATQGLPLLTTTTRKEAGEVEVIIAKQLSDRTNWRLLVSQETSPVNLADERNQLRGDLDLPNVVWSMESERQFQFPVRQYSPAVNFSLHKQTVRGNLIGMKGQYLLFDNGALNISRHRSYHIELTVLDDPVSLDKEDQMELFT